MSFRFLLILSLVVSLASCSEDDEKPAGTSISCAWFDADNCWRQSLEAADSCLWGTSNGTLAGDGLTCNYTSGSTYAVTFNSAVNTSDPVDTNPWNYSVNKDGSFCMSYDDTGDNMVLITSAGTFRSEISGSYAVLTCPDGNQYSISFNDYLDCFSGGSPMPSTTVSSGGSGFRFSFGGHPTVSPTFDCQ